MKQQPYYLKHDPTSDHMKRILDARERGCTISIPKLFEASIRTDRYARILKEEFEKASFELRNINFYTTIDLMRALDKIFEKYIISFLFTGINPNSINDVSVRKSVESGIMGMNTFSLTRKIEVECNTNFKENFQNQNEKLFQDFYDLLCHELTHRGQFLLRNHNNLSLQIDKERKKELKNLSFINDLNISKEKKEELFIKLYMSSKYEIMAFSNQIIEELRFNGMPDDKILLNLRSFSFREDDSMAMYDYMTLFDKNDTEDLKVLKKLSKCIYDYIKGVEMHNFDSSFTNINRIEKLKQEEYRKMKEEYKAYKPAFAKSQKTFTIKKSIKALKEAQTKLKSLKEDDAKEIEKVIDEIDTIVADAVENLGAADPIVGSLIDTAQELEMHQDIAEIEDEEEIIMEAEDEEESEDEELTEEDEDEGEDKEKVEEGEMPPWLKKDGDKEDDKKDDEDKKDDKKEESVHKPYTSHFKK